MLAVCKRKCQFRNRTVRPGTEVEMSPADITPFVLANFAPASGDPWPEPDENAGVVSAPSAAPQPDPASQLTVAELQRRLDEMGVVYKRRATREELSALYMMQVSAPEV